jgi:hypothetical protein
MGETRKTSHNTQNDKRLTAQPSKAVLKQLEPTHNRVKRMALGVFAVCRTENALCESGVSTLPDMRNLNTTITAIRFIINQNHPIRPFCLNPTKLDKNALRPAVERLPQYFRPPWTWTNIDHNRFDYELCAIQRGASNERFQAETFRILNEKYEQLNIHRRIEKRRKGRIRIRYDYEYDKNKIDRHENGQCH